MPGYVDNLGFLDTEVKFIPLGSANIKRINGVDALTNGKLTVIKFYFSTINL
jgi:hypothetical protein